MFVEALYGDTWLQWPSEVRTFVLTITITNIIVVVIIAISKMHCNCHLYRDLSWVSETVSPCVQRVRVYNCGKTSIPRRGWVKQTHLSLRWICIYNFVARVVAITSILIPVLPTQKIQTTKTFFEEYMLSRVWKEGGNVWGSWVKIPCHAMPYLTLTYTKQYDAMPYNTIPCYTTPWMQDSEGGNVWGSLATSSIVWPSPSS